MRTLLVMLIMVLALPCGCSWVGRTAGQAVAAVEDAPGELKSGYREGYQQETEKNRQMQQQPTQESKPKQQ